MNSIIGMGSNQDYRGAGSVKILNEAKERMIDRGIDIVNQSVFYQSPAFPDESRPNFTNCVVEVYFDGPPTQLLLEIQQIEKQLGRKRGDRWGDRTCDLDILGIGNLVLPNVSRFKYWANIDVEAQMKEIPDELILPHPRIQDRAFVLKPLLSIMPHWKHPVFDKTAFQMLSQLPHKVKKSVFEIV